MKRIYKIFAVTMGVIIVMSAIAVLPLHLEKATNRGLRTATLSKGLREQIKIDTQEMSAEEIRSYGEQLTCSLLSFSAWPWLDMSKGKANCIGYSQLCCKIINYALTTHGKEGKAKPVVGCVKWFGVNIHPVMKWCMPSKQGKNFVKDHDFVEFESPKEHILFSPTTKDLLFTDLKTKI